MIQLPINEDVVLTAAGKAFSLCVVRWDVYSGEIFDERFPPISAQPRDRYDYLLNRWFFFNTFSSLLDGRDHKVHDKHFGWNFYSG